MIQVHPLRLDQHPMNSGNVDPMAAGCFANRVALHLGNVCDVFADREWGDFDRVVSHFGREGQRILNVPALEDFVANSELHSFRGSNVDYQTARSNGYGARVSEPGSGPALQGLPRIFSFPS